MYPNVPWPILASFSNLVAASQNGKLYSSKYFSLSRAKFICNKLGDGVDGGVETPFKFVMAAVLRSVHETYGLNEYRCEYNGVNHWRYLRVRPISEQYLLIHKPKNNILNWTSSEHGKQNNNNAGGDTYSLSEDYYFHSFLNYDNFITNIYYCNDVKCGGNRWYYWLFWVQL